MQPLTCPNDGCQKALKFPPEFSGKKVRCPKCRTTFVLDAPATAGPSAAPTTQPPAPSAPPPAAPAPPPAPAARPVWADFDDGLPYLPSAAPARTYAPPPEPPTATPPRTTAAAAATVVAAAASARPPQPAAALPPPPAVPTEPAEPDERTEDEPSGRADPARGDRRDRIISAVAAVLVQAVVLLFIGLSGSADSGAAVPEETVAFAQLDDEQLTNTDDGQLDDSAASSGGDAPADTLTTPTVEIAVSAPTTTDGDGLDLSVSLTASGGGGAGGAGGDGFGFGSSGQGRGGEASFLGTTARGNRFCIIADNSGSMSGPPLEYVKQEILKTLEQSRGGAKFYIVFFNSVGEPQPMKRWASGRADGNELANWIRVIRPRGGTEPITGFEIALKLDPPPDVVYFMTDGGFAPQQVQQIDRLNKALRKPAVVHTICFLNNGGEPLLKQIAANAKGTYRFVPGFKRP